MRVAESDSSWPTVETLAAAMIQRAASSERLMRAKFLDEEARAYQLANELLRQEASAAISKALSTPAA